MPVREVLRMGHPMLRERAQPVEKFATPELRALRGSPRRRSA